MIVQASELGMGAGKLLRPQRGVEVIAMQDPGMDTT
jgi:hypothetical protein